MALNYGGALLQECRAVRQWGVVWPARAWWHEPLATLCGHDPHQRNPLPDAGHPRHFWRFQPAQGTPRNAAPRATMNGQHDAPVVGLQGETEKKRVKCLLIKACAFFAVVYTMATLFTETELWASLFLHQSGLNWQIRHRQLLKVKLANVLLTAQNRT